MSVTYALLPSAYNLLVESLWEIGSSYHDDTFALLESVHLSQQLIQRLTSMLCIPGTALPANSIELVNENDGGLFLPRSCKQLTHSLGSDTNEHLLKVRTAHLVSPGNT